MSIVLAGRERLVLDGANTEDQHTHDLTTEDQLPLLVSNAGIGKDSALVQIRLPVQRRLFR
jgi:hypothetical protein